MPHRWKGWPDLPAQPEPECTAVLVAQHPATETRKAWELTARNPEELADKINAKVADIRQTGYQMVNTVVTLGPEVWTYEYDSTGIIQQIFRNGDPTP